MDMKNEVRVHHHSRRDLETSNNLAMPLEIRKHTYMVVYEYFGLDRQKVIPVETSTRSIQANSTSTTNDEHPTRCKPLRL